MTNEDYEGATQDDKALGLNLDKNNEKPKMLETLERRCLRGPMTFRMRHPDGYVCTVKNPDCKHADKDSEPVVVHYKNKPNKEYTRCLCDEESREVK